MGGFDLRHKERNRDFVAVAHFVCLKALKLIVGYSLQGCSAEAQREGAL